MIRSMTGFGEAAHRLGDGVLRVQIKTVNHRFLNTSVRTPPGFDRVEHEIQRWLRPHVARGHVSVSIAVEREADARDPGPRVDLERARRYASLLRELREALELEGEVDLHALLRFSDIFAGPEAVPPAEVETDVVKEAVDEAARHVVTLREAEGARLRVDMEGRLDELGALLDGVESRAPERLVRERERLRTRIAELAESDDVDEDRLAREVAWLAEKWDIHEEIVRFRAHVALFRETLEAGEPVGKRLAFVVQEMHREANTIGSKANDAEIGHAAVAMKEEIEKLREQVENVE